MRIAREGDLAIYYAYDSIDRLTAEVWRRPSDNAQIYGFFYDYDGANNRVKMRREFGAGTEWDSAYFAYAADNSLTQRVQQTPPDTFLSTYYSYDANGALIKEWTPGGAAGWGNQTWGTSYGGGAADDVVYFEYGPQQLVTRIIPTNEARTQFYYDGRLNRYLIDKAGTPTYYLWDGLNQLEERDAGGNRVARYTHGNYRQYGIGSVVEVERVANGTTYFQYQHMDHRGTVYKVTDANQNTQLSYTQDAFGRQLATVAGANPSVPNALVYQTNWLSLNIGGMWYGVSKYRLYDFELGIFLSRDFLRYLNRYRAWSNNPTGQVDRNGLRDESLVEIHEQIADKLKQLEKEKDKTKLEGLMEGVEAATQQYAKEAESRGSTMEMVRTGREGWILECITWHWDGKEHKVTAVPGVGNPTETPTKNWQAAEQGWNEWVDKYNAQNRRDIEGGGLAPAIPLPSLTEHPPPKPKENSPTPPDPKAKTPDQPLQPK